MQTLLAILIAIVLVGGGYYWYTQNMAGSMQDEAIDPFGSANTDTVDMNAGANIPAGALMEDGTIPEASGSGAGETMPSGVGEARTQKEEPAEGTVKEFTVTGQNFSFSPNTIIVKKGDRVRIVFQNAGGTHNWQLEGYNIGTKIIQTGQTDTVEFTADQAGTFEFFCSVGNHRQMGMVGTLTVTQ